MGEYEMKDDELRLVFDVKSDSHKEVGERLQSNIAKGWEEAKKAMQGMIGALTKVTDRKKRGGGRNRNTITQPSATLTRLMRNMK